MPAPEVEPFNKIFRMPPEEAAKLWEEAGGAEALAERELKPHPAALPKGALRSKDGLWVVRNSRRVGKKAIIPVVQATEEELVSFRETTRKDFLSTAYCPSAEHETLFIVTPWIEGIARKIGGTILDTATSKQVLPYYAQVLSDRQSRRRPQRPFLRDLIYTRNWSSAPINPSFMHDTEPLLEFTNTQLHRIITYLGSTPQAILSEGQTNSEQN